VKRVAILQSNYIPWKGYFDLINKVDEFILYDDVQYTKNDWRNRNKIKTPQGVQWLTIPVSLKGGHKQKINEVRLASLGWGEKHWKTLRQNYSKAPFFSNYEDIFSSLYLRNDYSYLSEVNEAFIRAINSILCIKTRIRHSSEFILEEDRTERLLGICQQCNAQIYLSGPAAKDYFDTSTAAKRGIKVEWMSYENYPEYNQLYSPFEHSVSILDLLFNEGRYASKFMRGFTNDTV